MRNLLTNSTPNFLQEVPVERFLHFMSTIKQIELGEVCYVCSSTNVLKDVKDIIEGKKPIFRHKFSKNVLNQNYNSGMKYSFNHYRSYVRVETVGLGKPKAAFDFFLVGYENLDYIVIPLENILEVVAVLQIPIQSLPLYMCGYDNLWMFQDYK